MTINHINIEATKICNQACFYCFNESGPRASGKTLNPDEWSYRLKLLRNKGLQSVHLTGGEPFAYKYIIELIKVCQNLGLKTSILSNGMKISHHIGKHPKLFMGLELAQISLDSLNRNEHNMRRGYDRAYDDAITAIESLTDLSIALELSMVIDYQNIEQIEQMITFASSGTSKGCAFSGP
ncbi:MAG: radical SAM protein [Bacteroidetes bacterium]|nr:radical SAM protein [Bacteroidota bacterium]